MTQAADPRRAAEECEVAEHRPYRVAKFPERPGRRPAMRCYCGEVVWVPHDVNLPVPVIDESGGALGFVPGGS